MSVRRTVGAEAWCLTGSNVCGALTTEEQGTSAGNAGPSQAGQTPATSPPPASAPTADELTTALAVARRLKKAGFNEDDVRILRIAESSKDPDARIESYFMDISARYNTVVVITGGSAAAALLAEIATILTVAATRLETVVTLPEIGPQRLSNVLYVAVAVCVVGFALSTRVFWRLSKAASEKKVRLMEMIRGLAP